MPVRSTEIKSKVACYPQIMLFNVPCSITLINHVWVFINMDFFIRIDLGR